MKYLILTIFFLVSFVLPVMAEGPFRELDFEKACATAKEEKKVVLIDFFTTWCGPCKRLDAVTWKDKDVVEWLEKNTIALKIDAEKETDLAKRYKINAYPTISLIRPDGTEIDQLIGYVEPQAFLTNAKDSLLGKTAIVKATEKFSGDQNNTQARSEYARELAKLGKYEEALTHYLWCFDHGLEHNPNYVGVRLSFLLSDIANLGRTYKPAKDALIERRDKAEKLVIDSPNDRKIAVEMIALNKHLGKEGKERNLAFYNSIRERKIKSIEERLVDDVMDQLLESKRYNDIVESAGDITKKVEFRISSYQGLIDYYKKIGKEAPADSLKVSKKLSVVYGGQYFTALLGANKLEDAKKLAQQITSFDSSKETFSLLIKKAEEFDAKDLAKELSEQADKAGEEKKAGS